MRTQFLYLIFFIGIASCWLGSNQQAHGQLAQAIDDYKNDRPFQYAPCDPWTRSHLFNRQTKHSGLAYNCDGEESKRNSPYICWKTHYENDLPTRVGWWNRLSRTAAEVKQRIADGSCTTSCQETSSCKCRQTSCTSSGCSSCATATEQMTYAETSLANQHQRPEKVRPKDGAEDGPKDVLSATTVARSGGLESLDNSIR